MSRHVKGLLEDELFEAQQTLKNAQRLLDEYVKNEAEGTLWERWDVASYCSSCGEQTFGEFHECPLEVVIRESRKAACRGW